MHAHRLLLLLISLLISAPAHSACPNPQLTLADACVELVQYLDQQGLLSELDIDINHPADSQTVRTLQVSAQSTLSSDGASGAWHVAAIFGMVDINI
jgi:hypothetical protein